MGENRPGTAISAPLGLRTEEIPYSVVIVPWPIDSIPEMCQDLRDTALYADRCGAHLLQINLPGYSKGLSSAAGFHREDVWRACIDTVRDVRGEVTCPIVTIPGMYEENLYEERKNVPRMIGVIAHSPAARCGLRRGDVLSRVNHISITTRPQARDVLSTFQKGGIKTAHLTVRRE